MPTEELAGTVSFGTIFTLYVISIAFFMPTIGLSNAVAFNALDCNGLDTEKDFPPIRVFGTVGFIAAELLINFVSIGGVTIQMSYTQFITSAVFSLLMAGYSLTMPNCPVNKGKSTSLSQALGLDAFKLFKDYRMAIFFIFSMLLGVSLQITNSYGTSFIENFSNIEMFKQGFLDGWFAKNPTALISLSQCSEALCILMIPFCLKRFGIKGVMMMAMFAWVLRFGFFDYDHKKNSEAIFELPFNKDELSMSNANFFVPQAALLYGSYYYEDGSKVENDDLGLCGGGYGRIEFREDFVKSMDKTDARRSDMFVEYYNGPVAEEAEFGCAMMKFMGHIENGTRYYDGDMFVYRYADVLLMLAECENYGGGDVAQYINMIRERAYGENFDETVAYKNGDFAANELAILQERTKEFFGEGKRWFDLVRLQDASHKSLAYSAAASYNGTPIITNQPILWPIDTGVLSGDKLIEQTPGY